MDTLALLSGDKFFEENPDKILGEAYETTGRFGTVTKYRGTLKEAVEKMNIPLTNVVNPVADTPVISIITTDDTMPSPEEIKELVERVENNDKKISKRAKKNTEIKNADDLDPLPRAEYYTFEETYEQCNRIDSALPAIGANQKMNIDELRAYVWYMEKVGRRMSDKWYRLAGFTKYYADEEIDIADYMAKGILFYHKGEYLPYAYYFFGNLYDKQTGLEADREAIVAKFGEAVYEQQYDAFKKVFNEKVYKNRLQINPDIPSRQLTILPISDFASEFAISTLDDGRTFTGRRFTDTEANRKKGIVGKPDWKKTGGRNEWRDERKEFETLSLKDAFSWWIRYGGGDKKIKKNISWLDILDYYIQLVRYNEDREGSRNSYNRKKAVAKQEGDRLFMLFLKEAISEQDRLRIEINWNRKFNALIEADYDKIPVAFEYDKDFYGTKMNVRWEKREAVSFTSAKGSGLLAYGVGMGKANLLTSNILTPTGWVKMKDIKPGMFVIGKSGLPIKVLQIYPQGKLDAYRVEFSDGAATEVTGDHLWTVQNIYDRTGYRKDENMYRTLTTDQILARYRNKRGNPIYSIPMVDPVQFESKPVPIHPYLLGILIGDGCITNDAGFSNPNPEIIAKVKAIIEPLGLFLHPHVGSENKDFTISSGNTGNKVKNPVFEGLKSLGLLGKKSIEKFIPEVYLYNDYYTRIRLLQGIMDTDGYLEAKGFTTRISTSSERLHKDLVELIRSFGGTVFVSTKMPKFTYKGEVKVGEKAYILTMRLPKYIKPFTISAKADLFKPKTKYKPVRFITSIVPIGKHEAQCILVDSPDHLYCCDDYIVTHNTLSAIMTIKHFLEAGWCKRPFIVVPNQTYRQWLAEIRNLCSDVRVNDFYNLGTDYYNQMLDEDKNVIQVEEGSISVFTYEGFKRLGFSDQTLYDNVSELAEILGQNDEDVPDKQRMASREKIMSLMGKAVKGIRVEIESLGFDFMCVDEAHSMKKIFTRVKAKGGEKNQYEISSGTPSALGLKGFCISQYIQKTNGGRNILLLTATPFTNSPLEVYSMLSLIAYKELERLNQNVLRSFFDTYCMSTYDLVISAKGNMPERKQIFLGWNNLQALQKLIFQFMSYKEADVVDEKGRIVKQDRPNKYVLPMEKGYINGILQPLAAKDQIKTSLTLSAQQQAFMEEVRRYVVDGFEPRGATVIESDDVVENQFDDEDTGDEDTGELVDYEELETDEKEGVRILKGVNIARSLALSPYLYMWSNLGTPNYLDFVESSPKLTYVIKCVATVKKYHEDHGEPVSGQIIYMDRGKDYFDLIKEYLIKIVGYKAHEIGIIKSAMAGGKLAKEKIKNLFNGEEYDEKTGAMIPVEDAKRIKVLIGSRSIREGLNLQKKTTVLYNCYLDWNPTDEIQLEGRCHRQGNQFENVRIVIPLMMDSMDIFIFQKLEEKTARINAIWNKNGNMNVIDLKDFDPREQKFNLITDPEVLARMEVDEERERLDDDIAMIKNQIDVYKNIIHSIGEIAYRKKEAHRIAQYWRPKVDKEGNPVERTDSAVIAAIDDVSKGQKMATGETIKDYYRVSGEYFRNDWQNNVWNGEFHVPDWFKEWKLSVINLEKKVKTVLIPENIAPNSDAINFVIGQKEKDIESIKEKKELVASDEAIHNRVLEIRAEQAKRKIGQTTVEMRVKEFEKLNPMLSKLKAKSAGAISLEKLVDPKVCPPMDAEGKRRIDREAIIQLEQCISLLPQTKQLHTVGEDQYTEKRQELHREIIYKMFKGIACVEHEQPICILTAGAPGSGKSFFLKKYAPYMLSDKIIKIDADAIREQLPEYKGWNSNMTHREAKDIVNEAISYVSTPCLHDILYDGTMNTPKNYFPLIGRLKELGYKIFIVFVEIPFEESIKRTKERYVRHGRYVPDNVVREFFAHTPNHFDEIRKKVDGWLKVDGMTGEIVERAGEPIPQDREYFTQDVSGVKPEEAEIVAEEMMNKSEIESLIEGLRISGEFAEGEEAEEISMILEGLEIAYEMAE